MLLLESQFSQVSKNNSRLSIAVLLIVSVTTGGCSGNWTDQEIEAHIHWVFINLEKGILPNISVQADEETYSEIKSLLNINTKIERIEIINNYKTSWVFFVYLSEPRKVLRFYCVCDNETTICHPEFSPEIQKVENMEALKQVGDIHDR